MAAKLYHLELSHPSHAVRLMLEHKGVEFEIKTLLSGLHGPVLRLAGFPGPTVPALKLDGRRLQGSRTISRELDRLYPERPLFPGDPAVEEAERWGEEVLQPIPRTTLRWLVGEHRDIRRWVVRDGGVPLAPLFAEGLTPIVWALQRQSGATEASVRAGLDALPGHVDHVDRLIAAGTLDGEQLNAADYQIGTGLRVLLEYGGVNETIRGRPAEALARRVLPEYAELPVRREHFEATPGRA